VTAGEALNQYCPVARALELVGERWTLLVVREFA
jgi:DNA-binding HxlR family transcriptional regulator